MGNWFIFSNPLGMVMLDMSIDSPVFKVDFVICFHIAEFGWIFLVGYKHVGVNILSVS